MKLKVLQLFPTEWASMSEAGHLCLFNEVRPSDFDRIDYALLGVDQEGDRAIGYITVKELDHESVYWQFGGALPPIRDTIWSYRLYQEMLRWTFDRYERVTTYIENDNAVYLKMAAKVGFKIIGCRTFKKKIYLEHLLEREAE